jgi:lipocalin
MARPTTAYDFSKLSGKKYSGVTLDIDSSTSVNGFSYYDTVSQNTITFGATKTSAISGKVKTATGNVVFNANDILATNSILENNGAYISANTTDNRSTAIVASPDGKAIVVAVCRSNSGVATSCLGNQSSIEQAFSFKTEQRPSIHVFLIINSRII